MGIGEGVCMLRGMRVGGGGGQRCDVWLLGEAVEGGGEERGEDREEEFHGEWNGSGRNTSAG